MPFLRAPIASPRPCRRCGSPLCSLTRSGGCPECGLSDTAPNVAATERERTIAIVHAILRTEWRQGRWKARVVGVCLIVIAALCMEMWAAGQAYWALPVSFFKSAALLSLTTAVSLVAAARCGVIPSASYLSLCTLAAAAATSSTTAFYFLASSDVLAIGAPLAMLPLIRTVAAEVKVDLGLIALLSFARCAAVCADLLLGWR